MATDDESYEAYKHILCSFLPLADPAALDPSDNLVELGLDSLNTVALIVRIEEALDVTVPEDALAVETFETVGSLWRVITALPAEPVAS